MGKTVDEIIESAIGKGQFATVVYQGSKAENKDSKAQDITVKTITEYNGQFGVNFKNKKQYTEYRKAHEKMTEDSSLSFSWVVKNLIGEFKNGNKFLRLNMNDDKKPLSVKYFKVQNGVETEIDRETAKSLCQPSAFKPKSNDSGCWSLLLDRIIEIWHKH